MIEQQSVMEDDDLNTLPTWQKRSKRREGKWEGDRNKNCTL